jgi:DNA-binding NarL/FixJ family response regulator
VNDLLPRFVGREFELSTLRRALSEPAVVLVEGEAGIGKSRLVQEFVSGAAGRHRVLVGACPPLREPLMLSPVVDALGPYGERVAGLRLSALAGALRSLFPEWAAELPPVPEPLADPKAARHRLFRALADLIGAVGAEVLVIEDVHWADVATLEFLLFLASRWQPSQDRFLSLVVTYRPEEVPGDSLLLRLSSRLPVGSRHLRIPVPPLDLPDTARLVSSMLDSGPVSEAFAAFLHEHTEGVPLAVEESVRLLAARGDLVNRDGEWVRRKLAVLQVPPTVMDAVRERVGRLAAPAQRVLAAAAVLAEPADERSITTVAGLGADQTRAGLSEATAGGLLREDHRGRVAFHHILVGQAVYQTIPPADRRALHRAAGALLEAAQPAPLPQLTRHFRAADEPAKWAHYAELAAERASQTGDFEAALVFLNDVLTSADLPAPTIVGLARRLATAAHFQHERLDARHREAAATLRRVLDSTPLEPAQEAELRNGLGLILLQQGDMDGGRAQIERAVPLLADNPVQQARAIRLLGVPVAGDRPASDYRRWLERAAELDLTRLPPAERLAVIVDRACGLLQLGDGTGWAIAADLPTTAATIEERVQVLRGHHNLGWIATLWGHYDRAQQLMAAGAELAEIARHERLSEQIRISQLLLDWHAGRWDGITDRAQALADPDADEPISLLVAIRIGMWHLAQGAHRKAETYLLRVRDEAHKRGDMDDALEPAAALGRIRLLEGSPQAALAETDQPTAMTEMTGVWLHATDLIPVRVAALVAAGRLTDTQTLITAYQAGVSGCDAPAATAVLTTCQALLAEGRENFDEAAAGFGSAAQAWQRLPRPYDALLARERQATCELALGQHTTARDRLTTTFQALHQLGARGDAERIAATLRTQGIEVRREWRRGRRGYGDQLSPRELDVVRLVATGATNREVAATLSRSPKTVAGQLSSAMRKLGATSRTELAVVALRDGLVPDESTGPADR